MHGWTRAQVLQARTIFVLGYEEAVTERKRSITDSELRMANHLAEVNFPMPKIRVLSEIRTKDRLNNAVVFRRDPRRNRVEYRFPEGTDNNWSVLEDGDWKDLTSEELRVIASLKDHPYDDKEID